MAPAAVFWRMTKGPGLVGSPATTAICVPGMTVSHFKSSGVTIRCESVLLVVCIVLIDRNSLFQCRGRAPDKSTVRRRFHAFNV